MLEVELKASLGGIDPEQICQRAEELGFEAAAVLRERDIYFNGTERDFRQTDEALRLRSCVDLAAGKGESFVTYKGPKLDTVSNTRSEYETAVGDPQVMEQLLRALGYRPVFTVDKIRRELKRGKITLCLDKVEGLGDFLETELLAETEAARGTAVEQLLKLLDALAVPRENLIRHSYLEMLMTKK